MAALEATIVDAGGRDLRVSNPHRVIFPMTERSAAVTKLHDGVGISTPKPAAPYT